MSYTTLMVHWLDDVVNNIDDKAEYKKLLKTIAHKHKLMNLPTRTTVLYKDGMITFLEKRALFNKDELDKWRIFLNKTLDRFQHDYNVAQK
ncbi:hypothetical protein C0J52_23038 [Blattella germanica]|nr:hypothetical protein C0J52_23038 [Blattella germanica]